MINMIKICLMSYFNLIFSPISFQISITSTFNIGWRDSIIIRQRLCTIFIGSPIQLSIIDTCTEVGFRCPMNDIANWSTRCHSIQFAGFSRAIVDKVATVVDVLASQLTFGKRFNVFQIFEKAEFETAIVFPEILKKNL